jgi:WD40 repeat protein
VRLAYTKSDITSEQTGMAASADGKHLAFVFKDKTIKIFDVDAARFIKRFTGSFSDVFDLQLTHDGKLVMLQGTEIIVLDWKSEEVIAKFSTSGIITKSSYLASLNLLAVGQREGWVTIYDLNTGKEVNTFQYKKHHVSALALHPNGKSVAVGVVCPF